jgi:hypothetical protein
MGMPRPQGSGTVAITSVGRHARLHLPQRLSIIGMSKQPTEEASPMSISYERDQQWFTLHPTSHQYHRLPRPQEWPTVCVPPDAIVTVHFINAQCLVRVLALPNGPRLAEAIDTNPASGALSMHRALDARKPRRVAM